MGIFKDIFHKNSHFAGKSLRKLKAVPRELLPIEKLQKRLVQYIINLSENGATVERVALLPDGEGVCNPIYFFVGSEYDII